MQKELIAKLVCPSCGAKDGVLKPVSFRENDNVILDGALVCSSCRGWYPISDALLELVVPSLLDHDGLRPFIAEHGNALKAAGCSMPENSLLPEAPGAQLEQRKHFDWYAENEEQDYNAYQNTPFWRAADRIAFARWKTMTKKDAWILDVGSADGRSTFQWTDLVDHVVGFDISKKMIRKAIARARKAGVADRVSFFVGDADRIPVRDGAFDYACTYGVLHHVPNPGHSYAEIMRLLKPGGIFFASENNKSSFRAIFDWLMRVSPLWTELAGEEPLISRKMIRDWISGMPVDLTSRTSVFLPPHVFNVVGHRVAKPLMASTDFVCQLLPWLRHQGGLIVFETAKHSGTAKT